MSGLLYPHGKAANVAGFKIQTSVYGLPIPIVYGTARIPGNLIHMPVTPTILPKKGKGINTKGAQSGDVYTAPIIVALCEGEIVDVGYVWRDKDQKVLFSAYASAGYGLKKGTTGQTGWATLPSAQRLGYQSFAYVDHPTWPLPNDSLSSYSWEIKGFEIFGSGVVDASPADIIPDYLENAQYGVGFPSARVGSLTQFQDYCAAFGLFCSPAYSDQQQARDQMNELLEISNTGAVWSDGVLKFVPYGDTAATAHGHTFTPNTTPVYDLVDNDYLGRGEGVDPIVVTRKSALECFNQVTVEYEDRDFDYNVSSVKAEEQSSLLAYGPRPMPTLSLHAIKDKAVAQQVAWIRLQREQNIRNTYRFKLGWRFVLLEPMDLVTLTDVGLGLSRTPVRITQVVELSNEEGIEITAEDWPFGTASATRYSTASNSGTSSNTNVDPGNTATPIIFDGPAALLTSPYEVWIAASGGADWGGCDVYLSADNVNFTKVGTIFGKATYGATTATLATGSRYPAIDTTHTIHVDVTASGGALAALSQEQFDMLAFPCWIDDEFLTYRDLTLTSAFNYDLTHLYRGLYSSDIVSHPNPSSFVFCDEHVARIPWPQAVIGQTLYLKLPAFNVYGGSLQDIASVSSTSFVVGQDSIARQNSQPQGTVSISSDGTWTAQVNGSSAIKSYKYVLSTSGYVSDATVIASGTILDGRNFGIGGVGLVFGETMYISIVPFTYENAGGVALPSIGIQGSFQSYTGSITTSYAPVVWTLVPAQSTVLSFDLISSVVRNTALASNTDITQMVAHPVLPDGVTITQFALEVYEGGTSAFFGTFGVAARRVTSNSDTGLGGTAATVGGGWQQLVVSVSEDTTGNTYSLESAFRGYADGPAAAGAQRIGQLYITYDFPDPAKRV